MTPVFVNYEVRHSVSYILKGNDIFSVRMYGKYKFKGLIKITKKNNRIIECLRYTDE